MISKRVSIAAVLVFLILLTGCAKAPESITAAPTPKQVGPPQPTAQAAATQLVGVWKAEKIYGMSYQTKQWVESDLSLYPDTLSLYTEFTEKAMCGEWQNEESRCVRYDPYTITGNKMTVQQESVTGPPWNYEWSITNGKLELIGFIENQPVIKTIYAKAR